MAKSVGVNIKPDDITLEADGSIRIKNEEARKLIEKLKHPSFQTNRADDKIAHTFNFAGCPTLTPT